MGVATKFTLKQTCQKVIDGILGIAPKEKFVLAPLLVFCYNMRH